MPFHISQVAGQWDVVRDTLDGEVIGTLSVVPSREVHNVADVTFAPSISGDWALDRAVEGSCNRTGLFEVFDGNSEDTGRQVILWIGNLIAGHPDVLDGHCPVGEHGTIRVLLRKSEGRD